MSTTAAPRPFLRLPVISLRFSALLCVCMVAAAALALWATPKLVEVSDAPSLEETVPRQFGDWKEMPSPFLQVSLTTGTDPNMDQPYDQVVMRTYVDSQGRQVMLALAWGRRQKQEVKIHRPDLCYLAQGFKVKSLQQVDFESIRGADGQPVKGKRMFTEAGPFGEAVNYWMRIGTLYSEDAIDTRWEIFQQGLAGNIPDGILVRASMRTNGAQVSDAQWQLLDRFLTDLVGSLPEATRSLLIR